MAIIGVLALQGDFDKHIAMMRSLGAETLKIRTPKDLDRCDGLIIPGGESTAIMRQIDFIDMQEKLCAFAAVKPVFGTCAGLILMSSHILDSKQMPYQFLNITVERNAFGRQVDSFNAEIEVNLESQEKSNYPAFFIRAPRIKKCGAKVKILAFYKGEPVLVQEGKHLGSSFHPELTTDSAIHRYFLQIVEKDKRP